MYIITISPYMWTQYVPRIMAYDKNAILTLCIFLYRRHSKERACWHEIWQTIPLKKICDLELHFSHSIYECIFLPFYIKTVTMLLVWCISTWYDISLSGFSLRSIKAKLRGVGLYQFCSSENIIKNHCFRRMINNSYADNRLKYALGY